MYNPSFVCWTKIVHKKRTWDIDLMMFSGFPQDDAWEFVRNVISLFDFTCANIFIYKKKSFSPKISLHNDGQLLLNVSTHHRLNRLCHFNHLVNIIQLTNASVLVFPGNYFTIILLVYTHTHTVYTVCVWQRERQSKRGDEVERKPTNQVQHYWIQPSADQSERFMLTWL